MSELLPRMCRAICQSGKFETGQGTCAALCMDIMGDARSKPCHHTEQVHRALAEQIIDALPHPSSEGLIVRAREIAAQQMLYQIERAGMAGRDAGRELSPQFVEGVKKRAASIRNGELDGHDFVLVALAALANLDKTEERPCD